MKIIRLEGTEKKLYTVVAPLAMDANVLKQNNNYPFKTSKDHIWYVALDGRGKVIGFMPLVVKGGKKVYIDNYYMQNDDVKIADALIDRITEEWFPQYAVTVLAHKRHVELFRRNHFFAYKMLTKYEGMEYAPAMEEETEP